MHLLEKEANQNNKIKLKLRMVNDPHSDKKAFVATLTHNSFVNAVFTIYDCHKLKTTPKTLRSKYISVAT